MAGAVNLEVNLLGVEALNRKLLVMGDAVKDLRPAWEAIHDGKRGNPLLGSDKFGARARTFTEILTEQFRTQGRRGGTPWVGYQNEPRYRPIKFLFGGGFSRILRWRQGRERLYPSLVEANHPQHVFKSRRGTAKMGTSVPYAVKHQEGRGMQKFDNIALPRRRIIALKKSDTAGWARVVQRHIVRSISREQLRAARIRF